MEKQEQSSEPYVTAARPGRPRVANLDNIAEVLAETEVVSTDADFARFGAVRWHNSV